MGNIGSRLSQLTAADVMSQRVVMVNEETPVDDAALLLLEQKISGAPVVNAEGELSGVLSLTDLALPRTEHHETQRVLLQEDPETHTAVLGKAREISTPDLVRDRMSKKLISVSPQTPVVEVARIMCEGHWHRVPVLDEDRKLVGMISTMDLLAALVQAHDEPGNPG